ncbi:cytochrome P450 [Aphanothece hegewaldii CCALA 016]|uniref:Cytochrome P450 n=1 Tax=Aphanothece hegewaldii CCALA 016 TaxID=2107694 RepID=A0A2T1LW49_9CHRO|nr:cytochrome P450 [Aphanothece hegewaldii]PSF36129.1 cytochrome P450 [Aphanothece hegewaldii CCALA 016]
MSKLLSGPKTLPFLQLTHWILNPVSYMEKVSKDFPDLFRTRGLGMNGLIFISHPQALQQLLTNDRKQFSAPGEINAIVSPLVGDYSVIMLGGDRHKKRRQLLLPPFHGERMRSYADSILDITQNVMDALPQDQVFIARDEMQSISLQVIIETVFGLHKGERYLELKNLLSSMLDIFRMSSMAAILFFPSLQKDFGAWSPWGKFMRTQQKVDSLLYAEIAERQKNPDPNRTDILSLLMSARDEAGQPMSNKELRDELITLLFAGHETTATAMSWALYWTHRHPEIKDKILQELATLGNNPNPIDIARLPYLTAVCNETLRLYPVGMLTFPRRVEEPVEMLGYRLEAGDVVAGCIYLTHHRPELYPDSQQFKPERFLERQFTPYEFIPFGGGARRCIGEALAMFEMKLAIATILSRYELALADQKPEPPRRRGLTLAPGNGVRMVMKGKRKFLEPSVTQSDLVGV